MASGDLIDFDVIESQKENIQSIPSGRSAKKLAELFSPSPAQPKHSTVTGDVNPQDTKTIHEGIRAEFEEEVSNLSESDDPLDIFDRYVRWTLDAYPSAQATPQSQLHTLLERATKTFVSYPQYKNDPRYLKLWVHYIQLFSDAPRETFVFLARHNIGESLALFYEEYAAWLEGAGRWAQAEEIYKLGMEREARPPQRLIRKFSEFEQRREAQQTQEIEEPSSPALPTVRPALMAKIDPFAAAAAAARDPQAPRPNHGVGGPSSKPGKSKLTIFSDADAAQPAISSTSSSKGWDNIGSLADRKKENVMEARPWAGETLQAGGKKTGGTKIPVFRDPSLSAQLSQSHITIHHSKSQVTYNQRGQKERILVDLSAVYPTPDLPGTELGFEEIWAAARGWLDRSWKQELPQTAAPAQKTTTSDVDVLTREVSEKLVVHHDTIKLDENGAPIMPRTGKSKKKIHEVNETQIIKAKLDSPSRPKMLKKKHTSEPTMTMHTKAATDDIYDIFNAPIKPVQENDEEFGYETDDYTSGGESTMNTRNISTSDTEQQEDHDDEDDDEDADAHVEDETSDVKSVSEWSDFSTRKHVPRLDEDEDEPDQEESGNTQVSNLIDVGEAEDHGNLYEDHEHSGYEEPRTRTVFVPIPPEDYEPPTRPYRDPFEVANNRLPFMTPITERTETSLDVTPNPQLDIHTGTPSKRDGGLPTIYDDDDDDDEDEGEHDALGLEPLSSPLREVLSASSPKGKILQPLLQPSKALGPKAAAVNYPVRPKGPIIKETQCNPVDDAIRNEILAQTQPPLAGYEGFFDHRQEKYGRGNEIRKFVKSLAKSGRTSTDKTGPVPTGLAITFSDSETQYNVRKELGAGAFAPVYLVENSRPQEPTQAEEEDENMPVAVMGKGTFANGHHRRGALEAMKMEAPPTPWEFYMMRLSHTRLGPQHRAAASLSAALEMHLYQDEGFLVLPYHPHGTLLDVVNLFRAEPSGVMDETLAMFLTIELFRTVEALHAKQILHGDLKADNCLLRLDGLSGGGGDQQPTLAGAWRADGTGGWGARGVTLIDFGRAIDMRAFGPDVQFVADWKTSAQDCAEMREGRPWTWQIDYHGLAGIVHCLLFGKYIETVRSDTGALGNARRYKVRESLKRYWQTDIWAECFDVLLNPGQFVAAEDGARMPVLRSMRGVRDKMETWLQANSEKGVGLRSLVGKVEAYAKGRR